MLTKPRHNFENEGKSTFSMAATFKTSCIIITVEENKQKKEIPSDGLSHDCGTNSVQICPNGKEGIQLSSY